MLRLALLLALAAAPLGAGTALRDQHQDHLGDQDAPNEPAAGPAETAKAGALERPGVFQPAGGVELSLWFDEWQGGLLFLEVLEHGSYVNEGDVIARFDRRVLEEQLRAAETGLRAAEIGHRNLLDQLQLEREAGEERLAYARAALERSTRGHQGWEKFAVALRERREELGRLYEQHQLEDQQDELAQLEAMYRGDELTDATEEIVLKRTRRNLARTQTSIKIEKDENAYRKEYERAAERERRKEDLEKERSALERLARSEALAERRRAEQIRKGAEELHLQGERLGRLRHDLERLTVRAPQAGILLHGSPRDYEPGGTPPRHRRGGQGAAHATLFTVAPADRFLVAFELPEAELPRLRHGMAAVVAPLVAPEHPVVGRVRIDAFPKPSSAAGPENLYRAAVELDGPLAGVRAGMRATVKLELEQEATAVRLERR